MFRVFYAFLVLFNISVFAAEDDTYIFEAKGKFAKELKALVEKYSKDGKIDVKVMKPSELNQNRGIMNILLNSKSDNGDIVLGKKVYERSCFKCHGNRGEEVAYGTSKILADMKKEEIVDALLNYRDDSDYGGDSKMLMNMQASTLSTKEINSVADYIYSFKHKNNKNSTSSSSSNTSSYQNVDEEQSSYLK